MKKIAIAKAGLTSIVGNAGEYLVMGELLRRGVLAALTPRNSPGFDVIATDRHRTVQIRVKTKLSGRDWQWNAGSGDWEAEVFREKTTGDFCVLVDLANAQARFFIARTRVLERWLQERHKDWLDRRGRHGQKHSPDNRRRILSEDSAFLSKFTTNNWRDLGLRFQIGA